MKKLFCLTFIIGLLYGSKPVYAVTCDPNNQGCNSNHHIGVYFMNYYEEYNGDNWKPLVAPDPNSPQNPYDSFYNAMKNNCWIAGNPTQNAKCAHIYSLRRQSLKNWVPGLGAYYSHYESWPWYQWIKYVLPYNIIKNASTQEDPDKGWGDYDLVFFYGHNAHIKPTYPESSFENWIYSNGTWTHQTSNWANWGTAAMPYWYHLYSPITDAETNPYMVFYTTEPFTSVLIGKDFNPNGFWYENTWNQEIASYANTSLGYTDTKWIIAHGCSALPVVSYLDGTTAIPQGKVAWSRYWYRVHIAMGHDQGISLLDEPDLVYYQGVPGFSDKLIGDQKVQQSYFDIHTHQMDGYSNDGWPTALSAVAWLWKVRHIGYAASAAV